MAGERCKSALFFSLNIARFKMSDQLDISKMKVADLPRSLRHFSKEDTLAEAIDIAYFLQGVVDAISHDEDICTKEFYHGYMLVFNYMIDKMEICAGILKFPMYAIGDSPTLTDILEAGAQALSNKHDSDNDREGR